MPIHALLMYWTSGGTAGRESRLQPQHPSQIVPLRVFSFSLSVILNSQALPLYIRSQTPVPCSLLPVPSFSNIRPQTDEAALNKQHFTSSIRSNVTCVQRRKNQPGKLVQRENT